MTEKVWFITGTTTGLGREWAIAALDRGDRVAATARNVGSHRRPRRGRTAIEWLPIPLDVTDRLALRRGRRAHTSTSGGSMSW